MTRTWIKIDICRGWVLWKHKIRSGMTSWKKSQWSNGTSPDCPSCHLNKQIMNLYKNSASCFRVIPIFNNIPSAEVIANYWIWNENGAHFRMNISLRSCFIELHTKIEKTVCLNIGQSILYASSTWKCVIFIHKFVAWISSVSTLLFGSHVQRIRNKQKRSCTWKNFHQHVRTV